MEILRKVLPYIILGIAVIAGTKIIDHFTDTDDKEISIEKEKLLKDIDELTAKFIDSERERIRVQRENKILKEEIQEYETENDTTITAIRIANENRDFTRLDSLGDNLLDRMRRRRQH